MKLCEAMRNILYLLLIIFLLAMTTQARSDDNQILEKVALVQQNIARLHAQFVQSKVSDIFVEPQEAYGWIFLSKPGFLRWQYTAPQTIGVLLQDGQTYQLTLEQNEHESLPPAPAMINMLMHSILEWMEMDLSILRQKYQINLLPASALIIEFKPIGSQAMPIEALTIEFTSDGQLVQQVILHEKGGDQTTITFSGHEINFNQLAIFGAQ